MSCKHCTDPDGYPCFPQYGVGPHRHEGKDGNPYLGTTIQLAKEEWPDNYAEDPDCPGLGIWWCPKCGEGKPKD